MTQTPDCSPSPEWLAGAWADILTCEKRWQAERDATTARARLYIEAGLPLERVLDALGISRATWYRRLAEHDEERARNRALYESRPTAGAGSDEPDAGCVPGCQRVKKPHTGSCLRPNP